MFLAVNNEVETRREEPGRNLDLLFDDFGPNTDFFKRLKKRFFRPYKAFLAWFEIHWTYNSREN